MVDRHEEKINDENSLSTTKATPLQIGMGLIIVGASAGMTLYTKKTSAVLGHMDKLKRSKEIRKPPKYGPPTREDWDKMRPRW